MTLRSSACGSIALALLVMAAPAAAAAGPASAPVDLSPAEVREYWTPERMKHAVPPDLPRPPAPDATPRLLGLREAQNAAQGATAYAAVQIGATTAPGTRTHGKLFYTAPGAGDFVCSGTVVSAPNESTVWTAAHCVYDFDTATYGTNFLFVPAYDEGAAPFGRWAAIDAIAAPGYVYYADSRDDVGALVMQVKRRAKTRSERRRCGRFSKRRRRKRCRRRRVPLPIQDKVGARGIAFNQDPQAQTFNAYGYPVIPSPRFDGEHLERCTSPFAGEDLSYSGSPPIAIECDMKGGSSGGGWVIAGGRVNGTVSYGYPSLPDYLFGPYFDSFIKAFYDSVKAR